MHSTGEALFPAHRDITEIPGDVACHLPTVGGGPVQRERFQLALPRRQGAVVHLRHAQQQVRQPLQAEIPVAPKLTWLGQKTSRFFQLKCGLNGQIDYVNAGLVKTSKLQIVS